MHLLQWSHYHPEGNDKFVNVDVLNDLFPYLIKALRSQENASQLLLYPPEEEVVRRSQIQ